jgi:PD-(D/E)XK nuclease superfamily
MLKPPAWSYSSITLFDQCPKKYFHLRVAKDTKEPESDAMMYGKDVHLAAENYIKDGTPIPEKYAYLKPMLEKLNTIDGEKLCEYKMGLKKENGRLVACDFFAKDVWYRGVADLIILNHDKQEARVIDYKTGKSSAFPQYQNCKGGTAICCSRRFCQSGLRSGYWVKYIFRFGWHTCFT